MTLGITNNPDWLEWPNTASPSLLSLKRQYLASVAKALAYRLANAYSRGFIDQGLIDQWDGLSDQSITRILEAPSTGWHAFHLNDDLLFKEFIGRSIRAEETRAGDISLEVLEEYWSASGDFICRGAEASAHIPKTENRLRYQSTPISSMLSVDFRSPEALSIELHGEHGQLSLKQLGNKVSSGSLALYSISDQSSIAKRLATAYKYISSVAPHVAWFVDTFTLSLVVRVDLDRPNRFTSGSSGQFVGRTCLINPTAKGVDDAVLAEALIHEAIHSLLYMQERNRAWVNNRDVFSGEGYRTTSPWSDNPLRPRQFMQACFVWFGLYNFWRDPEAKSIFGLAARRQELKARDGFYRNKLADLTASWKYFSDPEVIDTIQRLQEQVIRSDFPNVIAVHD